MSPLSRRQALIAGTTLATACGDPLSLLPTSNRSGALWAADNSATDSLVNGASGIESPNDGKGWPQFFGPQGTGVADQPTDAPTAWSPEESIRWRTEIDGSGWSSPVHDEQFVYVTAAIDSDAGKRLVIHRLAIDSGELVATDPVFDQRSDRDYRIHGKNSHASPTLVIDSGQLIAHFGYQGTALMTTDGKKLWENRELVFPPVHGNGGSPIVLGDQIIFTCDGSESPYVASLDRENGSVRWRTDRPVDAQRKFSFATPAAVRMDGKIQVVAPGSDCLCGYDLETGKLLWNFKSSGFSVVPKPIVVGDLIVFCSGFMRPSLIAVKPGTKSNGWKASEVWRCERNVPKTPTPIVDGDAIVMVSDEGIMSRVSITDGEVIFKKRLGGNYSASPIKVGSKIYLTSEDGNTTVIASGDEYEKLAENELGERTFATMAVHQNDLIARTENAVYRIGV